MRYEDPASPPAAPEAWVTSAVPESDARPARGSVRIAPRMLAPELRALAAAWRRPGGTGAPGTGHPCAGRATGTGGDGRGIGEERGKRRCVPRRADERRPEDLERDFAVPRHAASSTSRTMTKINKSAISHPRCSYAAILQARRHVLRGEPDTKY